MEQKQRDYQLDNIKGLMIFCVIFTHAISNLYKGWGDHLLTKYFYYFVYSFHMPVFVFISGHLSRRKTDYETYILKVIKSCLIPYVVFNILYGFPSVKSALNIFTPKWTLWYLLSLFWWKILVEISPKIKGSLLIAFILALYIGVFPAGSFLSIARTIGLYPFFLAGYLCQKEDIRKIRTTNKMLPIAAFLLAGAVAAVMIKQGVKPSAMFYRDSYNEMGQTYLQGVIIRAVLMVTSCLCIFGFVALISERKIFITEFGMNSITVYLAHSVVIRALKYLKIVKITNPYVFVAFAVFFSLALCFAFGNRKVSRIYHIFLDRICAFVLIP